MTAAIHLSSGPCPRLPVSAPLHLSVWFCESELPCGLLVSTQAAAEGKQGRVPTTPSKTVRGAVRRWGSRRWRSHCVCRGKTNTCCSFRSLALMLQTTPLNLHFESSKNIAPKLSCGVPLGGQEGAGGSSSIFTKPAGGHFLSGHMLCPVHEAPYREQLCQAPGVLGRDSCAVFWEPSRDWYRHFQWKRRGKITSFPLLTFI